MCCFTIASFYVKITFFASKSYVFTPKSHLLHQSRVVGIANHIFLRNIIVITASKISMRALKRWYFHSILTKLSVVRACLKFRLGVGRGWVAGARVGRTPEGWTTKTTTTTTTTIGRKPAPHHHVQGFNNPFASLTLIRYSLYLSYSWTLDATRKGAAVGS